MTKRAAAVLVGSLLLLATTPRASGGNTGPAGPGPSDGALEARLRSGPSVADLVAYAYERNPKIQAARQEWRAVVEQYRVTTAYPDPQLSFTYFPSPIETRLGPQDWNATLSQLIPFPGRLTRAGELVEADARIARLNLDRAVRDVIVKVRESVHELAYIRDARRVAAQNQELLDHLRKVGETAYGRDRATLLDVVKAQSQSGQLQYDVLLLEELEQTERAQLNALLDRPPDATIGPLPDLPVRPLAYTLDEIYELARKNQEEIRIADTRIRRAETDVELARFRNYPDFKVGVFYAGIGEPDVSNPPSDAGDDALGIQAGVTIPLWFGKNRGRIARAAAQAEAARARRRAVVNDTYAGIRALYFRLNNARRLIQLYGEQLVPEAARSLEIAETWYREGQGSFSDFVETESVWYNFQLALARARADHGKFLARLERLAGRSLTERDGAPGADVPQEGAR